MNIYDKLTEKSWEPAIAGSAAANQALLGPSSRFAIKKTALIIFLTIVSVVFLLFFITFITHSQYPGFQALAGEPWKPFSNPSRLWLNTVLLGVSSLTLHFSLITARRGRANATLIAMLLAALFAVLFVLAQLWLWRQLNAMGYSLTSNPANSYFYMLTAIHAVHLLVGLTILLRVGFLLSRGAALFRVRANLALCTIYWHYLLALWLVLFVLLASSPETYNTIAALCGLQG
jgi:cytochrome c oxidase subunit 3